MATQHDVSMLAMVDRDIDIFSKIFTVLAFLHFWYFVLFFPETVSEPFWRFFNKFKNHEGRSKMVEFLKWDGIKSWNEVMIDKLLLLS